MFVEFLRGLLREGSAVLAGPPAVRDKERAAAQEVLAEAFGHHALDVAGPPVPFDADAALAAAALVWRACWFLVQRGTPPAEVETSLVLPPGGGSAAEHLSADVALRFLPQVHRRARAAAADDALTRSAARVLRQWPLSGVLSDLTEGPLAPVELGGHPGLLLLYAERLAGRPRPAWAAGAARPFVELVFAERGLPVPPPPGPPEEKVA